MEKLLLEYAQFHRKVENTPQHIGAAPHVQRLLHASIGLSTESAELLDVLKKRLYGEQVPIRAEQIVNLREECGDVFFYLWLAMSALNYSFEDMLRDNITKLSLRYSKKLESSNDQSV